MKYIIQIKRSAYRVSIWIDVWEDVSVPHTVNSHDLNDVEVFLSITQKSNPDQEYRIINIVPRRFEFKVTFVKTESTKKIVTVKAHDYEEAQKLAYDGLQDKEKYKVTDICRDK